VSPNPGLIKADSTLEIKVLLKVNINAKPPPPNDRKLLFQATKVPKHSKKQSPSEMEHAKAMQEETIICLCKDGNDRTLLENDESGNEAEPPAEFVDPISLEVMEDPVKTVDGQVYDRTQIETWLKVKLISPLTNLPLQSAELTPDTELRNKIKKWKERSSKKSAKAKPSDKKTKKPSKHKEESL